MSADKRLAELKLELPPAPKVMGAYRPVMVIDSMAYLSGHGPLLPTGKLITGRVGESLDADAGYAAAKQTGLAMLATLQKEFGSLDQIARLVKTFGMVQATPDFVELPAVINGFSDLMREVFGEENGVAARSAVGLSSLPAGMAVEIEAIFQIKP